MSVIMHVTLYITIYLKLIFMPYTSWYIQFLNKIVESFDIEDWSNGNFATTRINYILTFIKIENCQKKCEYLFLKVFFLISVSL